ncbi:MULTISPECIES: glyoxalase III HchA [unclassified Mycobacterium]|uniref:glyoxalase III HchA n=1 Tax=unclassified Mycobacterium TaxID=2642494 RepID=UPI000992A0D0|nr:MULTISPECIES: glyoxalase III HchA [unclassified Mycobacterium]
MRPTPDRAERNAFFPSRLSRTVGIPKKTDFSGADYPNAYTGGRAKILLIASEERYIPTANGALFSSGNHPVEMLLPLMHFAAAGFGIDVATIAGYSVKLETWALPKKDKAVMAALEKFWPQLAAPLTLSEVIENRLGDASDYAAVFIPGGHGVLAAIPESEQVGQVLNWALEHDKFIVSLCHGPASLITMGLGKPAGQHPLKGYEICSFPDAMDEGDNVKFGYLPGQLPWLVSKRLRTLGLRVVNPEKLTGQVHRDRRLLTGDSPLASNELGKLAANVLLSEADL